METSVSLSARRAAAARRRRQRRLILSALFATGVIGSALGLGLALQRGDKAGPKPLAAQARRSAGPARAPARHQRAKPQSRRPRALGPIPSWRPGRAELRSQGPARGVIALTFDDGVCRSCVANLLQVLERTGAHATICPNGIYGPAVWDHFRDEIRGLLARGQLAICNHTFSHRSAVTLGASALARELEQNERWIEATFGVTSRPFFRPPYGAYNASTLTVAGKEGYTRVVLWSGTLADSSPRSVRYELTAIRFWARPGAIILAHGNYPQTEKALPKILQLLRQRRLQTVTLPELLGGAR